MLSGFSLWERRVDGMDESQSIVAQTNTFARRTLRQPLLLEPTKGSMRYDAQGHVTESSWHENCVHMRLGPEGQSVGAEFRVTSVKSPILSMGKLVKQGYKFGTDWVQDVERESQPDVGRCEKFSLGERRCLHDG